MDDLISRQDAIKAIDEKAKRIKNEDTLNGLAGAVGILFDLPSFNSIKPELSDDVVSRQAVLEIQAKYAEHIGATKFWQMRDDIKALPSVKPQYTDDEIQKMQDLEQAEIQKAYELGQEDRPTGHWEWLTEDKYRCSSCNHETRVDECMNKPMYDFCPFCGAKMVEE